MGDQSGLFRRGHVQVQLGLGVHTAPWELPLSLRCFLLWYLFLPPACSCLLRKERHPASGRRPSLACFLLTFLPSQGEVTEELL